MVAKVLHEITKKQYIQAADHGSSDAMVRLGYCNEVGKGVPEDYDIAFDWYQKASDNALAE